MSTPSIPVPHRWSVETSRPCPHAIQVYRGEALSLTAELLAYGAPAEVSGSIAHLYWRPLDAADPTAWWRAEATASGNIVYATFDARSMDDGSSAYVFFLQAEGPGGVMYRANGVISMLESPGAVPNEIPFPPRVLDFATVEVANAPYYSKSEADAMLDAKADAADIPTALSALSGDATHRTVTDAEKAAWFAKQEAGQSVHIPYGQSLILGAADYSQIMTPLGTLQGALDNKMDVTASGAFLQIYKQKPDSEAIYYRFRSDCSVGILTSIYKDSDNTDYVYFPATDEYLYFNNQGDVYRLYYDGTQWVWEHESFGTIVDGYAYPSEYGPDADEIAPESGDPYPTFSRTQATETYIDAWLSRTSPIASVGMPIGRYGNGGILPFFVAQPSQNVAVKIEPILSGDYLTAEVALVIYPGASPTISFWSGRDTQLTNVVWLDTPTWTQGAVNLFAFRVINLDSMFGTSIVLANKYAEFPLPTT